MSAFQSKYSIELVNPIGTLLADLTGRAMRRQIILSRNEPEQISWRLDLNEFENYCRESHIDPTNLLLVNNTEVRVKRLGTYLCGGQLEYFEPKLDTNNATIDLRATGFLNLFQSRFTGNPQIYTATDGSAIGADLITKSQAGNNMVENNDFEIDTTGWTGSSTTISQSSDQAYHGTYSLKAIYVDTGSSAFYSFINLSTLGNYQAGAYVYIPVGETVFIQMTFGGLGNNGSYQQFAGTGSWQFISTISVMALDVTGDVEIGSASGAFTGYMDAVVALAGGNVTSGTFASNVTANYGIRIGSLATVGVHDRTYNQTNVKNALQDFTSILTGSFDFEFTYDKIFNTYAKMGTQRPDVIFEYPNNIITISVPTDGSQMANEVIGLGSGNGTQAQATYTGDNLSSQLSYQLRQSVFTSNAVDNSDNGLTDQVNAQLATFSFPLVLPTITVDGNKAPFVTDYHLGDYVRIVINDHPLLQYINGMYRIERITINIDDNDSESIDLVVSI